MLRMSTLFLVRAGYIRRITAGVYSWLPLGVITLRNIENIVRQEMDKAGFQEVHFPALLPKDAYEQTGRWNDYGPDLFRLQDRKGADYLLGPTHEEMFTLMVKGEYSSYKDLPLTLYQIQTKYRDDLTSPMKVLLIPICDIAPPILQPLIVCDLSTTLSVRYQVPWAVRHQRNS
jgi:prolyl-tRNA synthetase